MMKTVSATVVVLSLLAVCQSAPLSCENLVKRAEKVPAINGTWYFVAMSTDSWWLSLLMKWFITASCSFDITAKGPLNTYDVTSNFKIVGICFNDTDTFSFVNNSFLDGAYTEDKGFPNSPPNVLLHSNCADCILVKDADEEGQRLLGLLSRRTSVTDAEMEEFKKQAECLGWSTPVVLSADHDNNNCTAATDILEEITNEEWEKITSTFVQKLSTILPDLM